MLRGAAGAPARCERLEQVPAARGGGDRPRVGGRGRTARSDGRRRDRGDGRVIAGRRERESARRGDADAACQAPDAVPRPSGGLGRRAGVRSRCRVRGTDATAAASRSSAAHRHRRRLTAAEAGASSRSAAGGRDSRMADTGAVTSGPQPRPVALRPRASRRTGDRNGTGCSGCRRSSDRAGRQQRQGSTYPSAADETLMPRCTYGLGHSDSPVCPATPIASPSATVAPLLVVISARWVTDTV